MAVRKSNKPKRISVCLRLQPEVVSDGRGRALRENRTFSNYIERLIQEDTKK
jgi:hypothetical protein